MVEEEKIIPFADDIVVVIEINDSNPDNVKHNIILKKYMIVSKIR